MTNRSNCITTYVLPVTDKNSTIVERMEAFDRLPRYIRDMINHGTIKLNPITTLRTYQEMIGMGLSRIAVQDMVIERYTVVEELLKQEHYEMLEDLTS